MQQQIEFEATPFQHTVRIPDTVPDGVSVRITLSFDDEKINLTDSELDQTRVHVDQKTYDYFLNVLEQPSGFVEHSDSKRQAALAHIVAIQADWQGKPIPDRDALYDDARD